MELIVITIIVIAVVAVIFYYTAQNRSPAPGAERLREIAVSPNTPPRLVPVTEPSADVPLETPPEGAPGPLDALKGEVRAGMEKLFLPGEEEAQANPPAPPLGYGDIAKDVRDKVVEAIDSIHNFRVAHMQLQKILNDPGLNIISTFSASITADPVLSSKILKMVNSAYFGRAQKVNSIGHALFLLGMVQLREILYREGLLDMLRVKNPEKDDLIEALWRHAVITSICASHLRSLFPGLEQGTLFTAGLLHDVGKIILVRMFTEPGYTMQSTLQDEDRLFGVNHAVVGRMALERWGFSALMVSLIEYHHHPAWESLKSLKLANEGPQCLMVLYLANQLAKILQPGQEGRTATPFHVSYRSIIDQNAFARTASDSVFLSQITKSEAFVS